MNLLAAAAGVAGRGVWDALHGWVLDELGRDGLLDWSRVSIDSVSVRAKRCLYGCGHAAVAVERSVEPGAR